MLLARTLGNEAIVRVHMPLAAERDDILLDIGNPFDEDLMPSIREFLKRLRVDRLSNDENLHTHLSYHSLLFHSPGVYLGVMAGF